MNHYWPWQRGTSVVRHLNDRPFATAIGLLLFFGGLIGLTHAGLSTDALSLLVPGWLVTALSAAYALSGLLLLVGIGRENGKWEAAGCILAISGLGTRCLSLLVVLDLGPAVALNLLLYLALMGAFIERVLQVIRGERIIRVSRLLEVKFNDAE